MAHSYKEWTIFQTIVIELAALVYIDAVCLLTPSYALCPNERVFHFWMLRYSIYFGWWNEPLLKLPNRIIKVNKLNFRKYKPSEHLFQMLI